MSDVNKLGIVGQRTRTVAPPGGPRTVKPKGPVTDYKDILQNYLTLIFEVEGTLHLKRHHMHEGFTEEQWTALVALAKETLSSDLTD